MGHPNLLSAICLVWVLVVFVKSDELQRRDELNVGHIAMDVLSPVLPSPPPPPPVSPPPPPPPPPLSPPPPPPSLYVSPPPPKRHHPPPAPKPKSPNGSMNKSHHPKNERPANNIHKKSHSVDRKKKRAKQIGYWFVGAVGVLQVAVIGFLVYKRREISKMIDRHESSS